MHLQSKTAVIFAIFWWQSFEYVGGSITQSVGVMDKEVLFDEDDGLRTSNLSVMFQPPLMLPDILSSLSPTYCQTGTSVFRFENKSSAIVLSVSFPNSLHDESWMRLLLLCAMTLLLARLLHGIDTCSNK